MKKELIAALLHNPEVIFLDEPTIGLDFHSQKVVRQFLIEYHKKMNPIIILTSHYMEDIKELCKRIVIMRAGEAIYDGPIDTIAGMQLSKVIQFRLAEGQVLEVAKLPMGTEVATSDFGYTAVIKKELVSDFVGYLLKHYVIEDLNVLEPDVSHLISRIMRQGIT